MRHRGPWLAAILLLSALVYLPGMTGGFAFDDYVNIVNNPHFGESIRSIEDLGTAAWSGEAGPLKRPISMLTFALNSKAFGNWPMGYKITGLIVHLINTVLVYVAALLLFKSLSNSRFSNRTAISVGLITAGVWSLHPINLTAVLYVVQRMTSLAAMFSFAAVIAYCWGRLQLRDQYFVRGWFAILVVCPVFIVLGAYSKENALLVIPILAMIEIVVYRFQCFGSEVLNRRVKVFFISGITVSCLTAIYLLLFESSSFIDGYEIREFTLAERLLTESRVIWFYVFLIALPQLQRFTLYHDDFVMSISLTEPVTTLFAIGGLFLLVVILISRFSRWPVFTFVTAWFLIGHLMESSFLPLEIVHEHRNYFPSFSICFAAAYLIMTKSKALNVRSDQARLGVGMALIILLAGLTFLRANSWSDPVTLSLTRAEKHPASFRSVYAAARVHYGMYAMRGDLLHYDKAVDLLLQAATLKPSSKRPLFGLFVMAYNSDKNFKPEWRDELVDRLANKFFLHTDWLELNQFVKCHAENPQCRFPKQDIFDFFQAALSNSTISANVKSQILMDLAVFYINEAADYKIALDMLDEAVELVPDRFTLRMTRAEIMGLAGEIENLRAELRVVENAKSWRDSHEYSSDKIEALQARYLFEQR